jgi:quinol-cytochrome oxidoreductase complex cytochrome b subunit
MIIKLLIIFFVGLLEQILYTSYLISVDKRQLYISTLLMFIYMCLYLGIVAYSIAQQNWLMLAVYAMACGIGNYFTILWENKRKK